MVNSVDATEYNKGNALVNSLMNNKAVKVDRREFLYALFKENEQVN